MRGWQDNIVVGFGVYLHWGTGKLMYTTKNNNYSFEIHIQSSTHTHAPTNNFVGIRTGFINVRQINWHSKTTARIHNILSAILNDAICSNIYSEIILIFTMITRSAEEPLLLLLMAGTAGCQVICNHSKGHTWTPIPRNIYPKLEETAYITLTNRATIPKHKTFS